MRISSMQSEAARRAARKHGKLAPLKLRSSATSAHRPRMRACSSQQRFADRNRAAGQRGRQPTYGGAHLFCEGTIGPTEFCVIGMFHPCLGKATTVGPLRVLKTKLCAQKRQVVSRGCLVHFAQFESSDSLSFTPPSSSLCGVPSGHCVSVGPPFPGSVGEFVGKPLTSCQRSPGPAFFCCLTAQRSSPAALLTHN